MAANFRVQNKIKFGQVLSEYEAKGKKAMAKAVSWWHGQAVRHAPVAGGQMKQKTQPFVKKGADGNYIGGLAIGTAYAKYLVYGANVGVLKKVKKWRIGQRPISQWPAKNKKGAAVQGRRNGKAVREGKGNPNALLPYGLPFIEEAAEILKEEIGRS